MAEEGKIERPGKAGPVCGPQEFVIAAIGLEHAHIFGMCDRLIEAGASLKWVYDEDAQKVQSFCQKYPSVRAAECEEEILEDREVKLVCSALVPAGRCDLGIRVMEAGKDFFSDKPPLTTIPQLELARQTVKKTGRKYLCCYSERVMSEAAVFAEELIRKGEIGRVLSVVGLGPHKETPKNRSEWFYRKESGYGGILCDIGSHQIEQFLAFAGTDQAEVKRSQVANYAHPSHPEFEDYGDAVLNADNGASLYFRVDWFTPESLPAFGDGRTFILGTKGSIELRKYLNVGTKEKGKDHVFLINGRGETHFQVTGKVGLPFFGDLILDCLFRTENAMTQEHCFAAAKLAIEAEEQAVRLA